MKLELVDRRLDIAEILERRLFPSRVLLPKRWRTYYEKRLATRALLKNSVHHLKHAA